MVVVRFWLAKGWSRTLSPSCMMDPCFFAFPLKVFIVVPTHELSLEVFLLALELSVLILELIYLS
jgi:hypothetical protein